MVLDSPWSVNERQFPARDTLEAQLTFLLRYAVLAPSSHNSQPWRFRVDGKGVDVFIDRSRWLRVADADQRELHVSVGCAVENLLIAAAYFDLPLRTRYFPAGEDSEHAARLELASDLAAERAVPLFKAITRRHTNRRKYSERPLEPRQIQRLERVGRGAGLAAHLIEDGGIKHAVDELVERADAAQFADGAWREELGMWLGQGAFGTPWPLSKAVQFAVTHLNMGKSTAKKDVELIESAPCLGLIGAADPSRTAQLRAGQILERLWLTATADNIQLQPMNQILQLPEINARFRRWLPASWGEPLLIFRLGYAEPAEHTPRRPLDAVLIA